MNPEIITSNISKTSLREKIQNFLPKSKKIIIAVAFFNEANLIKSLLKEGLEVVLIVSLRPPTSYYALKEILHKNKLKTFYLGSEFHSKIYAFIDDKNMFIGSIVGSSNLTSKGLFENIETNVILQDENSLRQIEKLLIDIEELSTILQPDTLNEYKDTYDKFVERNPSGSHGVVRKQKPNKKNIKISKESSEYYEFWKVADRVKELVNDISNQEYPEVPEYLVIDHFWHWVVKICNPDRLAIFKNDDDRIKDEFIPLLFKDYCRWDKSDNRRTLSYTESMPENSKKLQRLLSKNKISELDYKNALEIYQSFHATRSRIQRFNADEKFISENEINKIRESLEYLLYSNDSIDERINNMISQNGKYKLNQFGPSCVQELLGWVNPTKMPIRNSKADEAIRLLGYRE